MSEAEAEDTRLARPPEDQLVVCHGDGCAPNTLLRPDRSLAGPVDLGDLGVADRWADLAVASWSTSWKLRSGVGGRAARRVWRRA